jgi:hypothetical protein
MKRYFPGPFCGKEDKISADGAGKYVNSGYNALRLILRYSNVPRNGTVAIPAYCCDAVPEAVIAEGYRPYRLDLNGDHSFWTNYDTDLIEREKISIVILVHLYGFLHPESQKIRNFCHASGILLIHDLAQGFGTDASVFGKDPFFYSFGAGKSSCAALGGEVFNFPPIDKVILRRPLFYQGRVFFKARNTSTGVNLSDRIMALPAFFQNRNPEIIRKMSKFQIAKALAAKRFAVTKGSERSIRYSIIRDSLSGGKIKLAYDADKGLEFKVVLFVNGEADRLDQYLTSNDVYFFRLFRSGDLKKSKFEALPHFLKKGASFIELSTECAVSLSEIKRTAQILSAFR